MLPHGGGGDRYTPPRQTGQSGGKSLSGGVRTGKRGVRARGRRPHEQAPRRGIRTEAGHLSFPASGESESQAVCLRPSFRAVSQTEKGVFLRRPARRHALCRPLQLFGRSKRLRHRGAEKTARDVYRTDPPQRTLPGREKQALCAAVLDEPGAFRGRGRRLPRGGRHGAETIRGEI